MEQLITELQSAEISKEAKEKTLDTLNAITGMLQSLRNNKVLATDEEAAQRDQRLMEKNLRLKNTF